MIKYPENHKSSGFASASPKNTCFKQGTLSKAELCALLNSGPACLEPVVLSKAIGKGDRCWALGVVLGDAGCWVLGAVIL